MPDFAEGDFVPTVTQTSDTGGRVKLHPLAELLQKVKEFEHDPEQLLKYKTKHYKGRNDTADIDALIHKAKVYQKKQKLKQVEEESVLFEREIATKIQQA